MEGHGRSVTVSGRVSRSNYISNGKLGFCINLRSRKVMEGHGRSTIVSNDQ